MGSGKKYICGPRGIAFASVSEKWRDSIAYSPLDLHTTDFLSVDKRNIHDKTASKLELTEHNISSLIGLGNAIDECGETNFHANNVFKLALEYLNDNSRCETVMPGLRHKGIISFNHAGYKAKEIVWRLRGNGINIWEAKGIHTPLCLGKNKIESTVRLSIHAKNAACIILLQPLLLRLTENNQSITNISTGAAFLVLGCIIFCLSKVVAVYSHSPLSYNGRSERSERRVVAVYSHSPLSYNRMVRIASFVAVAVYSHSPLSYNTLAQQLRTWLVAVYSHSPLSYNIGVC